MPEKYLSKSQQRLLSVLLKLEGKEIEGISPTEIALALDIPAPSVTVHLANLKIAGLAECMEHNNNRWRLTPRIVQISFAMIQGVQSAKQRIEEVERRYRN